MPEHRIAVVTGASQGLGLETGKELAADAKGDVKVNAVCPGWVRTEMGGPDATRSLEEGAAGIVWAATLPKSGPSGGYFRDGKKIGW